MEYGERHRRILAAHAAGDEPALVDLYAGAALVLADSGREDASCFFGTQAYVLALSCGSDRTGELHSWLCQRGRER